MKINGIDLNQIASALQHLAVTIIGFVLAIIMLGTVMRATGHALPYLPAIDATQLAYLCGAFWLYRGGR